MARRTRSRPPRPELDAQAELSDLYHRFSDLARRVFLERPHARDVVRSIPPVELRFKLDFSGREVAKDDEVASMREQLEQHLDDAILTHAAFRPGAVYCFFCERADCEHAVPSDCREVFRGYTETGLPEWRRLLDLAVEREHDGASRLAGEVAASVVVPLDREELLGRRLEDFARNDRAYDLMGQLAMGYWTIESSGVGRKFAVTLQVVRSSTRSGVVRLGVNTIGSLPNGTPALALLGSGAPFPYLELLRKADRRLASLNQDLRKLRRGQRLERSAVFAQRLLADMAHGFSRKTRRSEFRTEHAQQRSGERGRPTGMARQDLESAKAERVFFDEKEKTWVVTASKGRTHVFSADGLHVTSLHLDRRAIDGRLARRRWRRVEDAEFGEVREKLLRKID